MVANKVEHSIFMYLSYLCAKANSKRMKFSVFSNYTRYTKTFYLF